MEMGQERLKRRLLAMQPNICVGDSSLNSVPSKRRVLSALWAANIKSFRPDSTFREFVEQSQDSDMGDDLGTFEGIELSNGSTIDKEDMGGNSDTSNYVVARPRTESE